MFEFQIIKSNEINQISSELQVRKYNYRKEVIRSTKILIEGYHLIGNGIDSNFIHNF